MNLLDRIIGFFRGLFTPTYVERKGKNVSMEDAREIVSKKLLEQESLLKDSAAKKFATIKHLLSSLAKNAETLERQEINVNDGNAAFRRIVSTSQKNLARQLKGLASRLAPPQNFDSQTVKDYAISSGNALARDLMPYWKNIALTKLMLKDEIKSVGSNLNELMQTFQELNSEFDSGRIKSLNDLKMLFASLDNSELNEKELKNRQNKAKLSLREAELELDSVKESVSQKKKSPQAQELERVAKQKEVLEKSKEALVSSFNSEIAPVEKVLKRLYSAAGENASIGGEEKEVLLALLENPSKAIFLDPKGEKIKEIIVKAERMVERGEISLKENEKEKRLSALTRLLQKDFFTEYFWELNKIQSRQAVLEKKILGLNISSQLKELNFRASSAEKRLESEKALITKTILEQQRQNSEISRLKEKASSCFNSLFKGEFEMAPEN